MDASAQLTRRTVVGSFIFKNLSARSTSPPRVALFRRSSQVNTYRCVAEGLVPSRSVLQPAD